MPPALPTKLPSIISLQELHPRIASPLAPKVSSINSANRLFGGGDVYWAIRDSFTITRRGIRRAGRIVEMNWSLAERAFAGVPKFSYDPKLTQWMWMVDGGEWPGVGGRILGGLCYNVAFFSSMGLLCYYGYYRMYVNGKFDVIDKWKNV